ncbi:hypothetical protein [Thermococcus sp.]
MLHNGTQKKIKDKNEFLSKLKDIYRFLPTSALVRKDLRSRIRNKWRNNDRLRHFLMGNVQVGNMQVRKNSQEVDPTRFSAIQISHIYWNGKNWEFRIWGWVPKDIKSKFGVSRNDILEFIKGEFENDKFWKNVFGTNCVSSLVEYPNKGWNFVDFGEIEKREEKFEAFKQMVRKDE